MHPPRAAASAVSSSASTLPKRATSLPILYAIALLCAAPALANAQALLPEVPAAVDGAGAEASGADASTPVSTVTVTGALDREGENSFAAKKATLFKGVQDIRDIPQPVTVLTRQFLDDRVLPDLQEVMKNTPGVTVDYTDSERVGYYARGYAIDALQIDGLTMNQGGSIFVQPDTAVLERVEILRGASGMLRGSGNPSATVNLVRKRPTDSFQASAGLTLGSWDRRRLEADVSSPLNASGSIRGRVVAVKDKKEFFQKARKEDREVLYAVVEADLAPNTLLSASLQHTDLGATGAWGNLPSALNGSPLNLPRDTYLGAASNFWNRYNDQAMLELEHRFGNGWNVKLDASYTGLHMKPGGFKQTSFSRTSTTNPYLANVSTSVYSGDTSNQRVLSGVANGPFRLFGREHRLTVGAESLDVDTIGTSGYFNINPRTNVDIRTWNPYTSYPEAFYAPGNGSAYVAPGTETSQKGVYATTRLSLADPLALLLGTRASWWDYQVPSAPAGNYRIEREITPYAGITYDITNNVNAYASYTEIFSPQNYKDRSGSILAPVRGEDYEAGLKGTFLGGRLNASLALFRINNNGKAAQDLASGTPCLPWYPAGYCYVAGGKQRSEGFEAEVSGEILPGWQVMGGYTNTRTRYLSDSTAANVGQPLRSIDPKHLLRVFTSYRAGGALRGWTVGGGASVQSDTYVKSGVLTARQGGYAVFNAMAAYRFDKTWSAQVNVNNLFDKLYYAKYVTTGFSNYYGDPRNVLVSLRAAY